MAGNFEGIKTRNFGIEIEMTGLTRCQAAKAIAKVLGGTPNHEGGTYDKYTVRDEKGRDWSIVYDGSIKCVDANGNNASKSYSVELNSPVLGYEDIPLLQEVIRALRHAKGRCGPEYCCGTHIHISADDYTPQQIRNLVNIFASKEDFLWDALQVSSARSGYCAKADKQFVEELNRKKPKTMEKIKELWYHGNMSEQYRHYSNFRYRALNLHSFFQHRSYTDVTWETCTLREWLNNDFVNAAFSAEEQAIIPTVTVYADKNPEYSTNPGNATQDKIFLLSITEASKYFSSDSARQYQPTDYAVAEGAFESDFSNCVWWLRSPGINQTLAAGVDAGGDVYEYGYWVNYDNLAVRPALWIDLNS